MVCAVFGADASGTAADWGRSGHDHLAAAQCAADIQLRYAQAGTSLATAALAGARHLTPLRHYPQADVHDAQAGTSFYYHAHAARRRPDAEHGHFHLFLHAARPDRAEPAQAGFSHLAGLSLDARGQALRWFTTNRWVTGENWRTAPELIDALGRFRVHTGGRLAPVARWLSAMVALFTPQLQDLLQRRDDQLARHAARVGWDAAWDDRTLDVVTECPAALSERVRELLA